MIEIVAAIKQLMDEMRTTPATAGASGLALAATARAVERVNGDLAARAELLAAVEHAEARGIKFIDGVHVFLLRCLLDASAPEGGRHE